MANRTYNSHPRHEQSGSRGRKGTKLDLSLHQVERLLNGELRCLEVPGKKQLVAVLDNKIYVFQPDGVGGFHAYPSSGNEVAAKYLGVSGRVAAELGVNVKRLSRMQ